MNAVNLPAKSQADDPSSSFSDQQLATCARLLAASIAHHRVKFGVIPIANTYAEIARVPPANIGISLKHSAAKGIDEALAVLHRDALARIAAEQREPATNDGVPETERRRQLRISVTAPVQLCDLKGGEVCKATVHNISWGGAAVRCDERVCEVGERLVLLLPAAGKRLIRIEAVALRESLIDDRHEYGLRFDSLDPDDEERLLEVLEILMKVPDSERRRSEVRLVQRLEVEYGDAGEFRATLEDISTNGMMLTVPDAIEIGDSVLVALSSADTPFGLNLRARVVHQTLVEGCDIDMYRVGLEFERPSPRLRERISAVLHELTIVRLRDMQGIQDFEGVETELVGD